MNDANRNELTLQWQPSGRNGEAIITASLGGEPIAKDTVDLTKSKARTLFAQTVAQGRPGIDARAVDDELLRLAAEMDRETDAVDAAGHKERKSQATMLVELASDCDLFHTPAGDGYATFRVDEHRETWPVRNRGFKRWLSRRFYLKHETAPGSQALNDALNVIDGTALFGGPEREVHVRVAEHDGRIFIDLCNAQWEAVEIAPSGWRVVDDPTVRFRRAKAMMPLPYPAKGGSVSELRSLMNVSKADWPLVPTWMLAAMRPRGPYPILCLHGEQGTAKSTDARILRSVLDPNCSPLRSEPREPRDLMISANNGWVITLDNLSRMPTWLSDALCRLSTGGGFATRTLYENDEETIFDAMRPIVITSIEEVGTRGDLLDRSVLLSLPTIPDSKRMKESDFWRMFHAKHAAILGAMLDAVSEALRRVDTVTLSSLPRMADFAVWGTAGEKALGLQPGEFMAAYTGNREAGNELAIEASPVGKMIMKLMSTVSTWSGTATDLLGALDDLADEKVRRLKSWPQTARKLGGDIKRLAPNLRAVGIEVDFGHQGRGRRKRRWIVLRKVEEICVPNDPNVPTSEKHGSDGDDGDAYGPPGDAAGTQTGIGVSPCEAPVGTHGDDGDAELQPLSDEVVEWTG